MFTPQNPPRECLWPTSSWPRPSRRPRELAVRMLRPLRSLLQSWTSSRPTASWSLLGRCLLLMLLLLITYVMKYLLKFAAPRRRMLLLPLPREQLRLAHQQISPIPAGLPPRRTPVPLGPPGLIAGRILFVPLRVWSLMGMLRGIAPPLRRHEWSLKLLKLSVPLKRASRPSGSSNDLDLPALCV